ncbi:MAG: tRNA (N6-isopentenyl adenosine(37)-C2)-methylthiotransferase MiaB [Rickettsiales bacterium]|nr:MAG: tRNA (N6-isopentenyl adenosine(37)-C2)-methylthiotransferase MiaB [Rickettsiales bacterium]
MLKKLFIKTYGCQMNVYDSIKMQEILAPFGFESTEDMNEADMVILNTCHIREKAAEKVYSELGRVKKIKDARKTQGLSDMIIVVAGCVGQAEGDEIFRRAHYVDIVVGPQSYHTLPDLLAKLARSEKRLIDLDFVEEAKFDNLPQNYQGQGASAFVSIQEGCDKFCTYCVVPYTRGAEFSRNVEEIYRESMVVASKGAKEVHLLGQNVNAYHGKTHEGKRHSIADLIRHIATLSDIERIRYTTSHPSDMTDDLIALHGLEPKLMPFLHLPVQSGSNKVLKGMNRKHSIEEYLSIIDKLRVARPDIVMSSDFIVGFPGESDEDFADTLDLVKKVQYGQCYSFKYSPRPGTPAATMEQIPEEIKTERLAILQKELSRQQFEFNESCIGRILPVLFEKNGKFDNHIVGKTPYMQSAYIENADKSLIGRVVDVKITKGLAISVTGELVKN